MRRERVWEQAPRKHPHNNYLGVLIFNLLFARLDCAFKSSARVVKVETTTRKGGDGGALRKKGDFCCVVVVCFFWVGSWTLRADTETFSECGSTTVAKPLYYPLRRETTSDAVVSRSSKEEEDKDKDKELFLHQSFWKRRSAQSGRTQTEEKKNTRKSQLH